MCCTREIVLTVAKAQFAPDFEPEASTPIVRLTSCRTDYIELIDALEERSGRDMDTDAFEALFIAPGTTLGDVMSFVDSSPLMTIRRLALRHIASFIGGAKPEAIDLHQHTSICATGWKALFRNLNTALRRHNVTLVKKQWFNLGRTNPEISEIVAFVENAYTAELV